MKKIEVKCECKGTGFIAGADNGGEGIEHVECGQHHPAYKADTGSLPVSDLNIKGVSGAEQMFPALEPI
jgi:hypothetical protein